MPNCTVVTCKNRSETKNFKNDGVTYHTFPKEPKIKEKWINATGRGPNWFPVQRSVICSDHFNEKCFQSLKKSRRLFEWAIPTLKICLVISTPTRASHRSSTSQESTSDGSSVQNTEDHAKETQSDNMTLIIKEELSEEEHDVMKLLERKRQIEADSCKDIAKNEWNHPEFEQKVEGPAMGMQSTVSDSEVLMPEVFMEKVLQSQNDILTTLKSQVLLSPDPELTKFLKFIGAALQRLPTARAKELQDQITEMVLKG